MSTRKPADTLIDGRLCVVVGSSNIDFVTYVDRMPVSGETVTGTALNTVCGGKGANQCIQAKKLGMRCGMISKIGDDTEGKTIVRNFEKYGIDTKGIVVDNSVRTGVAQITVDSLGNNCIIVVPGANSEMVVADINEDMIFQAQVVVCQFEISLQATECALQIAHSRGIITILNPAPAIYPLTRCILDNCDVIVPNETEAAALVGLSISEWTISIAQNISIQLINMGCKNVCLTMGSQGVIATSGINKVPVHIQPPSISKVISTVGAGDSFVGALCYFYRDINCPDALLQAATKACQVASMSVAKKDAQESYPTLSEYNDAFNR